MGVLDHLRHSQPARVRQQHSKPSMSSKLFQLLWCSWYILVLVHTCARNDICQKITKIQFHFLWFPKCSKNIALNPRRTLGFSFDAFLSIYLKHVFMTGIKCHMGMQYGIVVVKKIIVNVVSFEGFAGLLIMDCSREISCKKRQS